jgi:hypothetical protein
MSGQAVATRPPQATTTAALPANPTLDALRQEVDATAEAWDAVSAELEAWREQSAVVDSDLREATTARTRRAVFDRRRELRLRAAELPDEVAVVAEHFAIALEAWALATHRFAVVVHNEAVTEAEPLLRERAKAHELLSPSRPMGQRDANSEAQARATAAELGTRLEPILARRDAARDLVTEARGKLRARFGDNVGREGNGRSLNVLLSDRNEWVAGVRRAARARLHA